MIDFYPQKRPLIVDIIGHPWMRGECATQEEIKQEFEKRKILAQIPNPGEVPIKIGDKAAPRRCQV